MVQVPTGGLPRKHQLPIDFPSRKNLRHQRVDPDPVQSVHLADHCVGGHVLNPGSKHLALGLRHAVDLRHHGNVGQ